MKIGFVGIGKLGLIAAEVMADAGNEVFGYDISSVTSNKVIVKHSIQEAVSGRELIFIAVPTPHVEEYGGHIPCMDLTPKDFHYEIVKSVLSEVNKHVTHDQLVVLISTVLPGTTRKELRPLISNARFIYNPYLIAMGSVAWDMVNPEMVIIGTEDGDVTHDAKILIDFYKSFMENNPRYEVGTWDEAEGIKIFYNTFISTKIGLVNMIQDVAEKNGNMNVDVITNALARSTHRITGPAYLKAGMGDAGGCHPRDNIALRYLAQELDLGYDMFEMVMRAREVQAENLAKKLVLLFDQHGFSKETDIVWIHGKAFKPNVTYIDGSYSILIAHYVTKMGYNVDYVDPLTNNIHDSIRGVVLMAHHAPTTYGNTTMQQADHQDTYCKIESGSVVVDPWRYLDADTVASWGCTLVKYGNTRSVQ